MNKKFTIKHALYLNVIALLTSFAMLLSCTYAWFTETVTSTNNEIVAGNLHVSLKHSNGTDTDEAVENTTKLFDYAVSGATLWEPGAMAYETFTVENTGNLALKYQIGMNNVVKTGAADLSEVIKVAITNQTTGLTRDNLKTLTYQTISDNALKTGKLLKTGEKESFTIVLYWEPSDNDNNYNRAVNDTTDYKINFGVLLNATQYTSENDSFDNQYDAGATGAGGAAIAYSLVGSGTENITIDSETKKTTTATTVKIIDNTSDQLASATIPADDTIKEAGTDTVLTPTSVTLTIEDGVDTNFEAVTNGDSVTYEVTLKDQDGKNLSSDNGVVVTLKVGMIDLVNFYHNGVAMTKVANASDVVEDGEYYYDGTDTITFKTKTFSPFTATYKFAGGLGTETYPYLIETYDQLINIDVGIGDKYPEDSDATIYYKLIDDINVAAHDGSDWCHGDQYQDPRTFVLNLNGKTVTIGNKHLYGYARHMEVSNGTINYTGTGAFVDYACYQDVDSYCMNFHDLTLTGVSNENGNAHYGPLVAYAFGINSGDAVFTAERITNNLTINSSNSTGYVGGLFGYVQGSHVSAIVKNCTFNGTISAPYAGGFLNPCSYPNKAAVVSEGNVLNGTLLGAKTALAFGCNVNITGGSSTLTELNNSVTISDGALITTVTEATDLFTIDNNNQVIIKDNTGVTSYRAAVMFMVDSLTDGTGGYPRYITKDIPDNDSSTYETGVYRLPIQTESSDGSTSETLISNNSGTVIWRGENAYCYYSADFALSNNKATVYVYGYDAEGQVVTYQALPYTY